MAVKYDPSEVSVDELRKKWSDLVFVEEDSIVVSLKYSGSVYSEDGTVPEYDGTAEKVFSVSEVNGTGDWTFDESQRFESGYYLKNGNFLPSPALSGENGEYIFNKTGVDSIKSEIARGRAVAVSFCADQSMPGEILDDSKDTYINFVDKDGNVTDDQLAEYWTHYTYDREYDPSDNNSVNKIITANHAVCVVGYDDNFPKEYFKDPNGTIGGNGAWLVKNSWGVKTENNGAVLSTWGNEGTGYFWLSYYDQSICEPESFDFDVDTDTAERNINMYDFLPHSGQISIGFDSDVYMANVFTAKNNCTVRYIGLESPNAATDIEYSVYMLSPDAKSPIDGTCFASATEHFNYAGYHVVDIGKTCLIPEGMKYSIVAKATNGSKSEIYYTEDLNKNGYDSYGYGNITQIYAKAVVNPGESYVGTSLDSSDDWTDWSDVIAKLKTENKQLNNDGIEYDNFPIRSYPQTEVFTILNYNNSLKDTYAVGDTIEGKVSVTNNSDIDFDDNTEIKLIVTIGQEGKKIVVGTIGAFKSKETKEFTYQYTITENDAAKGEVTSTVKLLLNGVELNDK